MIQQTELTFTEIVEIFKYGKNNDEYWNRAKLHKQIVEKTLLIAAGLYLRYLLCFLFNNITSHSVYIKDDLLVKK